MKRKKGFFSISAVAEMFSVHQQTIRLYEKEGLITPKRSEGNTRLFSEEDVDRLEEIIYLTHQLGINLAGVEMIFKLKKQINKMQKDMNKVFDSAQEELDTHASVAQETIKKSAQKLVKIKKPRIESQPIAQISAPQEEKQANFTLDNWAIEYEDE